MPQLREQSNTATPRQGLGMVLVLSGLIALLAGAGLFAMFNQTTETSGMLWWQETHEVPWSERVPLLQGAIVSWILAPVLGAVGIWLFVSDPRRKVNKLNRYMPILKGIESMPIQQIAGITNTNPSTVYRDIQKMIDSGMANDIYLDYQGERVVSKKFVPERSHKTVVACPSCNARSEVIVGVTRTCPYCSQPLPL